jgi:hypothetical protein
MKGATQLIISTSVRMRDFDMRTLAASDHYDIITEAWLERCCAAGSLVEPRFAELLGMTPRTRARMSELADRFGDSYSDNIDEDKMRALLASMLRSSGRDATSAYGRGSRERPRDEVSFLLFTVTFHANRAHNLTRSP